MFALKSISPKMFIHFVTTVNVDTDGDRKGKFDLAGNAIPSVLSTPKDVSNECFRNGKKAKYQFHVAVLLTFF